jgi:hypothetical protein
MSHDPLLKVQPLQGTKPTTARNIAVKRKPRSQVRTCIGVFSVAALIGVAAILSMEFESAPSPVVQNSPTPTAPNTVGTITVHSAANGCQHRRFDNQTGLMSDTTTPCQQDVPLDAKGVPIPMGTVHTLNAISKSFK